MLALAICVCHVVNSSKKLSWCVTKGSKSSEEHHDTCRIILKKDDQIPSDYVNAGASIFKCFSYYDHSNPANISDPSRFSSYFSLNIIPVEMVLEESWSIGNHTNNPATEWQSPNMTSLCPGGSQSCDGREIPQQDAVKNLYVTIGHMMPYYRYNHSLFAKSNAVYVYIYIHTHYASYDSMILYTRFW